GGELFRRIRENDHLLTRAYRRLRDTVTPQVAFAPDAEWLLDNFYLIEDVLRGVRTDLPRGFYKELPALAGGPLAGYPRVYALAVALIAHTDSSLDEAQVHGFVRAYQTA